MKIIVNIDVPELIPAIEFYSNALGLQHSRTLDDVAELVGGSAVVYLLRKPAGSDMAGSHTIARNYSRHWTPVHMDFVVDNIAIATARAIRAGAIRESDCVEWSDSKCTSFSDPFGNGFCLLELTGETYNSTR